MHGSSKTPTDSEFRYTGMPLPALKSADTADRVLYAGTFSKVLFPALGLAYLVVPVSLANAFTEHAARSRNGCAQLHQETVADFIELGHFSRHMKRMRSLYAARRQLLADALRAAFGHRIRIDLQMGGMHLLARLADTTSDSALASRARSAGLALQALSERSSAHAGQGLLIGFTNVCSQGEAVRLARRLKAVLDT